MKNKVRLLSEDNNEIKDFQKSQNLKPINVKIIIKDIIISILWIYAIVKLFIHDIDLALINKYLPGYIWIFRYKFAVVLTVIALLTVFINKKSLLINLIYLMFYPLVLFFWKIPIVVFKKRSWNIVFVLINIIVSYYKSLRYNILISSIYLISIILALTSSLVAIRYGSLFIIVMIMIIVYFNRFMIILKPSEQFKFYKIIIEKFKNNLFSSIPKAMNEIDVESLEKDEKSKEKYIMYLQSAVLFNRISLLISKEFKNFKKSSTIIIMHVLDIAICTIITIYTFAVINFAIYEINSSNYSFLSAPDFFDFFYYSFSVFINNSIESIFPSAFISQFIHMAESLFSYILLVITVSILYTYHRTKNDNEIDILILNLENNGYEIEQLIEREFKIKNIDDAINELTKLKATMINLIFKLSEYIK